MTVDFARVSLHFHFFLIDDIWHPARLENLNKPVLQCTFEFPRCFMKKFSDSFKYTSTICLMFNDKLRLWKYLLWVFYEIEMSSLNFAKIIFNLIGLKCIYLYF